ncbi:ribonuclease P protein component [Candidatus Kuenenbacteria bacterium]|nr:ribonuclease P protein component [Candidatus Kuenenbacteria bacterium]
MLAKKNRLSAQKEYDLVFKKGQIYFSPFFNVRVATLIVGPSRFGIVTSTNISKKAVARNLIKRRIRAIISKNLANIKDNLSITIHVKPASLNLDYPSLEKELLFLFKKGSIFKV